MAIKAILFDFDGTLVDSHMASAKYILPEFCSSIKAPNLSWRDISEGAEGASALEIGRFLKQKYSLELSAEEIIDCWRNTVKVHLKKHVPFKTGAIEFLKMVKNRGIKIGIASNNFKGAIEDFLNFNNSIGYFNVIVGQEDVRRLKPFPDPYLAAIEKLNVKPDECLVFEDSLEGIEAAKAAGIRVVGIYEEANSYCEAEIKRACHRYIYGFDEFISIFENELVS